MKTVKIVGPLLASALLACAPTMSYNLVASPDVPAAIGTVKASQGSNGNTNLKINVEHMAPAEKVSNGASSYVVWVKPSSKNDSTWQNVGALQIDMNRRGQLSTVTPIKDATVAITAERAPGVTAPSGPVVMRTQVTP